MPHVSIMIKPASSLCNLGCKYCFYHSLADSRESYDYGIMSSATAEKLISDAFSLAEDDSVAFAFQGGEPLIAGAEYFERFTEFVRKANAENIPVYYSLQTNGTLINEEWARFFKKHGFLIGLSLDGDRNFNRNRMYKNGAYAYNDIIKAADILTEYGVDFNVLTVLTADIAENIETVYNFFTDRGFRYLQFIPCLRPFGDKSESRLYMTAEQYGDYLVRIFNLYVKDYVSGNYTSVRQLDNYVRLFRGEPPEQCGMNGHCSHQLVIEGNGNVYPCDFYCLDEYLLGNVNDTSLKALSRSASAIGFIEESLTAAERCKTCPFYKMCRGGGCKRSKADRDYCTSYKKFFSSCLPLFRVFLDRK